MRSKPHQRGRAILSLPVAVSLAALTLACQPTAGGPAIPLYPHAETARLPLSEVAQVVGPIAAIDGNQVIDYGRPFELLPGCHLVEMQRRIMVGGGYVRRTGFSPALLPRVVYALRMRAGARYVIQQDHHSVRGVNDPFFQAREEQPNGAAIDLAPVKSPADIKACQGWETAVLRPVK